MRRPALSISLYLKGTVLLVAEGEARTNRTLRLEEAGATIDQVSPKDFKTDMCRGKSLVMVHAIDDIQFKVVQAARLHGAMTYAHDMPDLSDFAMPALWSEGPLKIAISTDAMAPALARRLREQLGQILNVARPDLKGLLEKLSAFRNSTKKGDPTRANLYKMASKLQLTGTLKIRK